MDEESDEDAVYGDEVAQVIPIEDADGLHDQEEGTCTARHFALCIACIISFVSRLSDASACCLQYCVWV